MSAGRENMYRIYYKCISDQRMAVLFRANVGKKTSNKSILSSQGKIKSSLRLKYKYRTLKKLKLLR
jgi:hypothetical protein